MRGKKVFTLVLVATLVIGLCTPSGVKAKAENDNTAKAKQMVSKMSLEEKVGQVLMPSIQGFNGVRLTKLEDGAKEFLQKYNIGGYIMFGSNFDNVPQTVKFTDELHNVNKENPILISVDQEGGGTNRIVGATSMPGNMALAATRDKDLVYRTSKAIGEETHAVGIDINFAPVLDVYTKPTNTVIGVRSFGEDANLVTDMGIEFVRGMQESGVSATAKHFAGNGNATTDTHADLFVNPQDIKSLNEVDLKPFKGAIDAGLDMIMTSHVAYSALDNGKLYSEKLEREIPIVTTLSEKIVTNHLKGEMGFKGVVVTDAMDMQAITKYFSNVDATLLSLKAGCDIILMSFPITGTESVKEFDKYFNGVVAGVKSGKVSEERLNDAVTRIIELKIKRGLIGGEEKKSLTNRINDAVKIVGSDEFKKLEEEAASKAVTVIKNEDSMLPMKLNDGKTVLVIDYVISGFFDKIQAFGSNDVVSALEKIKLEQGYKKLDIKKGAIIYTMTNRGFVMQSSLDELKSQIDSADYVIFAPYQFDSGAVYAPFNYLPEDSKQIVSDLIDYTNKTEKKYGYINVKDPYDIAYLPNAKNMVAGYASLGGDITSGVNMRVSKNTEMAVRAIFGLIDTTGKLPVNIRKGLDPKIIYKYGEGIELKKITEGYIYKTDRVESNEISMVNKIMFASICGLIVLAFISSKRKIKN